MNTIRLTRFCSAHEFISFLEGKTLKNDTDHRVTRGDATTSVGFCFSTDNPKTAWRYLKGIVGFDVCMVLDMPKHLLTPSIGRYTNYSSSLAPFCYKTEFCCNSYSLETARLVKVLYPEDFATKEELKALTLLKLIRIL